MFLYYFINYCKESVKGTYYNKPIILISCGYVTYLHTVNNIVECK